MNCLPCFSNDEEDEGVDHPQPSKTEAPPQTSPAIALPDAAASSKAQAFTFRELAMATKNFRQECLLGEGGFGRVFKGKLQSTGQVVAVKQLDRNGMQGNKEFLVEILMLSLFQHPNLISLIGYCADGDQRLLVYEFMPMGSLENHLFGDDPDKKKIDWFTRMKIASGAAKGLEYLHDTANPPMIYRDLKPSNILLEEGYESKLSDYGLAKLGAGGGKMHPTSRVMGTYGYSAPEYSSSGELTLKSDIYSFGVVLLELITGRKVIDTNRPNDEQNLVTWAQPIFREPKRFPELADPRLNKEFPVTGLNQAVGICAMCLQEESSVRPLIGDVVAALSFLSIPQPITVPAPVPAEEKDGVVNAFTPPPEQKMQYENEVSQNQAAQPDKDGSSDDDGISEESEDEESDRESASEHPNEGSSQNSVSGSYNTAEGGNNSGRESAHYSDRRSTDYSEEESNYSDSDVGDESDHNDDSDHTEHKDPGHASANRSKSKRADVGTLSSKHGSGKRSSSTKKTSSQCRKMVVTFKEPALSSKRNDSDKFEEERISESQRGAGENRRQSSSSSSESSSESEGEEAREDRQSASKKKAKHRGESVDIIEGRQDSYGDEGPKLRHLKTR